MAVMTNCALIGMNPEVRKLLPSDVTAVNIVLIFVAVEVGLNEGCRMNESDRTLNTLRHFIIRIRGC